MKVRKGRTGVPQNVYWHNTMQKLVGRIKSGEGSPSANAAQVLLSAEYHRLPASHRLIVRKAARGKDVTTDIKSTRQARPDIAVEHVLLSPQARTLKQKQIVSLVMQLEPKRQKDVLFKMPGQGDAAKASMWQKIQAQRSNGYYNAIKRKLQDEVNKMGGHRAIPHIAKQIMTISPRQREGLLKQIGLNNADIARVFKITASKESRTRQFIQKEVRGWLVDEYGFRNRNPLTLLPNYLRPVFRAYAKDVAGRKPYFEDFMQFLHEEAERRGMTLDEFKTKLAKDYL